MFYTNMVMKITKCKLIFGNVRPGYNEYYNNYDYYCDGFIMIKQLTGVITKAKILCKVAIACT